ncbi:MAG: PQQ-binding-like beta-propeller repeat protein [Phycisphaerae bacterium]|nr:PQQ-binding-like beta-propeller repeat protein [Phycisphaerae bacterium]MDW8262152.1 PQQ-binding-like beta-propeller repeat protein [Phycisphaerales bacterium]
MKILPLSLGLAIVLVAVGCTTRPASPPTYGEIPAGAFAQSWQVDLPLAPGDTIVGLDLLGELVIARTGTNQAFAISAAGGTVRWASQVVPAGRSLGAPVLVGESIVFPTTDELVVFDRLGRRQRVVSLGRAVRSRLATDGTNVYLGFDYGTQGRLGRVSIGETAVPIRWELMHGGAVSAAPAVFQGDVYSAGEDGKVYAVNQERLPIWTNLPGSVFATAGPIVGDLRVDDTGVYVASTDTKFYSLDRITGRIRWQYFAGVPLTKGAWLTDDSVYLFVPGEGIVALDKLTGAFNRQPRWKLASGVAVAGSDRALVYVVDGAGGITAVRKDSGEQAFRTSRNDMTIIAEAPGSAMLFAATRHSSVIGIRPVKTGGTSGRLVLGPAAGPWSLGG